MSDLRSALLWLLVVRDFRAVSAEVRADIEEAIESVLSEIADAPAEGHA